MPCPSLITSDRLVTKIDLSDYIRLISELELPNLPDYVWALKRTFVSLGIGERERALLLGAAATRTAIVVPSTHQDELFDFRVQKHIKEQGNDAE